jgi:hypothetical protein
MDALGNNPCGVRYGYLAEVESPGWTFDLSSPDTR